MSEAVDAGVGGDARGGRAGVGGGDGIDPEFDGVEVSACGRGDAGDDEVGGGGGDVGGFGEGGVGGGGGASGEEAERLRGREDGGGGVDADADAGIAAEG